MGSDLKMIKRASFFQPIQDIYKNILYESVFMYHDVYVFLCLFIFIYYGTMPVIF